MVTKLHRHMGTMIRKNVIASLVENQNMPISPFWYALGNMLPDICWLPVTHPHFAIRSFPYIFKKLQISLEKSQKHAGYQAFISPIYSVRLGVISHYLCDFFCAAHQGTGINGARRHLDYEHNMRDFFYEHQTEVEELCRFSAPISPISNTVTLESLYHIFEHWQECYHVRQANFLQEFETLQQSAVQSAEVFLNDIRTAIECCTCLIYAFTAPSQVVPAII